MLHRLDVINDRAGVLTRQVSEMIYLSASDWADNPDACYDSLQWPIEVGSPTPHRVYYDCRFLKVEWRNDKCRLTVGLLEVA